MVIVDFHAEATSEKVALARYLDGRVTAVLGTHTHVQTNDARVLAGGTAAITDAGMTGPHDSVIGSDEHNALKRFVTGMPTRLEPATGDVRIEGVLVDLHDRGTRDVVHGGARRRRLGGLGPAAHGRQRTDEHHQENDEHEVAREHDAREVVRVRVVPVPLREPHLREDERDHQEAASQRGRAGRGRAARAGRARAGTAATAPCRTR